MQDVLLKKFSVEELFRRNRRFGASRPTRTGGELPTRVRIDSSSSESRTIVEVFAHDRSGLLYSVSKAIHDLNLSVDLAKIATHLNQVLDVIGEDRLRQIQTVLEAKLSEFENTGWKEFA
jgi:[protein-PII] uridylyltransferase